MAHDGWCMTVGALPGEEAPDELPALEAPGDEAPADLTAWVKSPAEPLFDLLIEPPFDPLFDPLFGDFGSVGEVGLSCWACGGAAGGGAGTACSSSLSNDSSPGERRPETSSSKCTPT